MDSFDGSRRRDPRSAMPSAERRFLRDGEPLEQRLDRWMSTGRQLVEGVSGARPGGRQGSRRAEGSQGNRGGFDGLGRWVEDRLDWLLDDSDDWPEPWQESDRRPVDPTARRPAPLPPGRPQASWSTSERDDRPRRRLEAISRRGLAARQPAAAPAPSPQPSEPQDWPDDSSFSVARWQRPAAPLLRPDPLQEELEERDRERGESSETPPAANARPLPRSSRRR